MTDTISPIKPKQRYIILDTLRGLALLGICLANFPEFSLYTFLPEKMKAAMPTAEVDTIVRYLQYIFIDGKFYTIFSLLFGIGFSIILSNAEKNNRNGIKIFYRRMLVLFLIVGRRYSGTLCLRWILSSLIYQSFGQKTHHHCRCIVSDSRGPRCRRRISRLKPCRTGYCRHRVFSRAVRHNRRKLPCVVGRKQYILGCVKI